MDENGMEDKFKLQEIPGKGLGLVATTYIPKGTRIFAESPLFKYKKSTLHDFDTFERIVNEKVEKLSDAERELYFNLSNVHPTTFNQTMGIFKTNALPMPSPAPHAGVFLKASRINHACSQNSLNAWNEDTNQLNIHAIKDIDEGSEITISYLGRPKDYSSRQSSLKAFFNFTCTCTLCSMPPSARMESDRRLHRICQLEESVGDNMNNLNSPLSCLRDAHAMLQLLQKEGSADPMIPLLYHEVFEVAILHGDQARASVFAQKAHSMWVMFQGDDHAETRRMASLANNPSKHKLYGASMRWKSTKDAIPKSLNEQEFDAWLWRMPTLAPTPCKNVALADLRANAHFPTFDDLPSDNDVSLEDVKTSDGTPQKHWCFLAELVEVSDSPPFTVYVRDKAGKEVRLECYTEDRPEGLAMDLRKGHTIAILYAKKRGCLDMSVGVRLEETFAIKVFPISLDELLKLNDRVHTFSRVQDGKRKCHGCNKKMDSLSKCAKCSFFWFCSKECQAVGWKTKNHKDDCKVLQDANLQAMYRLDWGTFADYFRFST